MTNIHEPEKTVVFRKKQKLLPARSQGLTAAARVGALGSMRQAHAGAGQRTLALAAVLAALGAACLVAVPLGRAGAAVPTADLELGAAAPRAARLRRAAIHVVPGQQLVGGTETYPYWEREYTGDPEAFADDYIDLCIRNLYPEVGCPGKWDSLVWNPIRDTYDEDHPELDAWPPP